MINDLMCKDAGCACSTAIRDANAKWAHIEEINHSTYNYDENSDIVSFGQCYDKLVEDGIVTPSGTQTEALQTMRYLESYLVCSGMCEIPNFYVSLNNVETGPPKESCLFDLRIEWINAFSSLYGFFVVITLFMVAMVCCSGCLCHNERKQPNLIKKLEGKQHK